MLAEVYRGRLRDQTAVLAGMMARVDRGGARGVGGGWPL